MITRQQVRDVVAAALNADAVPDNTANAFAQHLATALDALGLSQFCDLADEPEREQQINQQANAPVSDEQYIGPDNKAQEPEWATHRNRAADR